ncbi:MAG: LamG-like jellyroll fold domain-containing protein [Myxococcota bacterium]
MGLGLGLALGACDHDVFVCSNDAECVNGDDAGVCQQNGWCSFWAPDCPSKQRYGELADDPFAGECVAPTADATEPEDSEGLGDSDNGTDDGGETDPDDVPRDDTTETGSADPEGTTGDVGPQESSSSGDLPPQPVTDCPDDPDLALCVNFDSFEGSTVYDDRDPTIAGVLTPTAEIADGLMGNALTVWGDGGHLNLGDQIYPTGSFTVEVWFRLQGPSGEWPTLVNQWTEAGGFRGFWLGGNKDGNRVEFWVDNEIASSPVVALDTWTRVTATHDANSGQMRLYLDGQNVGSALHLGPLTSTDLPLRLGDGNFGAPLDGQIDSVRLWDRALAPEEI